MIPQEAFRQAADLEEALHVLRVVFGDPSLRFEEKWAARGMEARLVREGGA